MGCVSEQGKDRVVSVAYSLVAIRTWNLVQPCFYLQSMLMIVNHMVLAMIKCYCESWALFIINFLPRTETFSLSEMS